MDEVIDYLTNIPAWFFCNLRRRPAARSPVQLRG